MSKPVFEDLFTLSGRRNRKSYLLYLIAAYLILALVWAVAMAAAMGNRMAPILIAALVTLAMGVSHAIVSAQRCRDFGWTGWAILIALIPVIGWIFPIAILFIPGNQGANRYGPDPLAG